MKPYIIGIAGGSGSGKSTFAKRIFEAFPNDISLISCDNYYLPHDELPLSERAHLNYDAPEALEFDLMVRHLEQLKNGESALCPVYDFSLHTRSDKITQIDPRPIILIDGILIFHAPALRNCMDLKIYVETDADERILRRILRDTKERARSLDSVISQYLTTVKPMHEAFVEPYKRYADVIVPGGGNNPVALEMIVQCICKQTGLHTV